MPSPSKIQEDIEELRLNVAQHTRRVEELLSVQVREISEATAKVVQQELQKFSLHSLEQPSCAIVNMPNAVPDVGEEIRSGHHCPSGSLGGPDAIVHPSSHLRELPRFLQYADEDDEQQDGQQNAVHDASSDDLHNDLQTSTQERKRKDARVTMVKLDKSKVAGMKQEVEAKMKRRGTAGGDESTWSPLRRGVKHIVAHPKFELSCSVVISLCAVQIGYEADWTIQNVQEELPLFVRISDIAFNVVFLIELIMRVIKDRPLFYWSYFNPNIGWNVMDTMLVLFSILDTVLLSIQSASAGMDLGPLKVMRMIRLVRLMRVIRVVRFFSELRVMVNSVMGSAKSLAWALLLITLVMFVFGVIIIQCIVAYLKDQGDDVQDPNLTLYYGSLMRCVMTLYRSISGGMDWQDAIEPLDKVSPAMEYVFCCYVFFTMFCCLNIVTGIFVENAKTLTRADADAMFEDTMKERKKWISIVADLFANIASANNGGLSKAAFVEHLNDPRVATCFENLGINTETTNTDELWDLFDADDGGYIDQDEFALGIKQFHGPARSIDLFKVRRDIRALSKRIKSDWLQPVRTSTLC